MKVARTWAAGVVVAFGVAATIASTPADQIPPVDEAVVTVVVADGVGAEVDVELALRMTAPARRASLRLGARVLDNVEGDVDVGSSDDGGGAAAGADVVITGVDADGAELFTLDLAEAGAEQRLLSLLDPDCAAGCDVGASFTIRVTPTSGLPSTGVELRLALFREYDLELGQTQPPDDVARVTVGEPRAIAAPGAPVDDAGSTGDAGSTNDGGDATDGG